MTFISMPAPAGGYQIIRVTGTTGEAIALFADKDLTTRVVDLLNRHGLIDAPIPEVQGDRT